MTLVSGQPTSHGALRQMSVTLDSWLEEKKAVGWIIQEVATIARSTDHLHASLEHVLRAGLRLKGRKLTDLVHALQKLRRPDRRLQRSGVGVLLMDVVCARYPEELKRIRAVLAEHPTDPAQPLRERLRAAHDLAADQVQQPELLATLVAVVVGTEARRALGRDDQNGCADGASDDGTEEGMMNESRERETSDESARPVASAEAPSERPKSARFLDLVESLAGIPADDELWDEAADFAARVLEIQRHKLTERETAAREAAAQEAARARSAAVRDALLELGRAHDWALGWFRLELPAQVPGLSEEGSTRILAEVGALREHLDAYVAARQQRATDDAEERHIEDLKRAAGDAVRARHASLLVLLEAAAPSATAITSAGAISHERPLEPLAESSTGAETAANAVEGAALAGAAPEPRLEAAPADVPVEVLPAEVAPESQEDAVAESATPEPHVVALPEDAPMNVLPADTAPGPLVEARPEEAPPGTVPANAAPGPQLAVSPEPAPPHPVPAAAVPEPPLAALIEDEAPSAHHDAEHTAESDVEKTLVSAAEGARLRRALQDALPVSAAPVAPASSPQRARTDPGHAERPSSRREAANVSATPAASPMRPLEEALWSAIAGGDGAGAYWLARVAESTESPAPVPSGVLAALQASRWMGASESAFVGDVVDIVDATVIEPGSSCAILGVAAALLPVLVAPETKLRAWLDPTIDARLAPVVKAVAEFANHGRRLSSWLLEGLEDEGTRTAQRLAIQSRVKRLNEEAPRRTTKYQPATRLWQVLFKNRFSPLLEKVADGNTTVCPQVDALLRELSTQRGVDHLIDALDAQLRPGWARSIHTGARVQLHGLIRQTLDELEPWATHVHAEMQLSELDWLTERVKALRKRVETDIAGARLFAEELRVSGSPERSACGAAIERSLADLAWLLRIDPAERRPCLVPELAVLARGASALGLTLADRLLWCPDAFPNAAAREPELLARAPELLSPATTTDACLAWADRARFDQSDRLLAFVDEATKQKVETALERAGLALEAERDGLQSAVELGVLDGYVGDERAELINDLETVRPRDAKDVATERGKLGKVRATLDRLRQTRLDEALSRWSRCKTTLRGRGIDAATLASCDEALEQIHARGDVRVLDERLVLFEQAERAEDLVPQPPPKSDFFGDFRKFVPTGEALLQQGWGALRGEIQNGGQPIPGRTLPSGEKRQAIVSALDAWFRLKRRREIEDAEVASLVSTLLTHLGFVPTSDGGQVRVETRGQTVCQLVAAFSDGSLSPVPQFGSQARGEQRVVCVWERPGADSLGATVTELPAAGRALIVFYLGRLSDAQRARFRTMGRDRGIVFLCLDELLLLFLAGESEARLRAFFLCALPYAALNPYTPFQAGEVPPEMYYGRRELVRELQRPEGSCIVYGGRQLGKSALLREVARQFHRPQLKQFAIVVDIVNVGDARQAREASSLWGLVRDRLRDVGAFETKRVRPEEIVEALRERLSSDRDMRILLLLDEADHLLDADARDGFNVVNHLRRLMVETSRRFKVVLAGLHNVQRFQLLTNQPLAQFGRAYKVGPLEPQDAALLVRQPLAALGFHFESDDDVLRILSYTNYHPGLVQLFCHDLLSHLQGLRGSSASYTVTRQHVDIVRKRDAVRTGIRDRFDWTLALDPRYQAIAWALIVEQSGDPSPTGTFSVRELGDLARSWWPKGFTLTNDDEFRGLLDEMCGLGVLVGDVEQGFRLRSPNVVQLMGDVEARLMQLAQAGPPSVFDVDQLHRHVTGNRFCPLTLGQERQLLAPRWGVGLIFGSDALGLGSVQSALVGLRSEESAAAVRVELAPEMKRASDLSDWLGTLPTNLAGMLVAIVHAPADAALAMSLVRDARRHATKRASSVNAVGRIVFIFGAAATATWTADPESAAIEERSDAVLWLHKWTGSGVRARLQHHDLLGTDQHVDAIQRVAEGWGLLLDRVFDSVRSGRQDAHDRAVEALRGQLADPKSAQSAAFVAALGVPAGSDAFRLLSTLHVLGMAVPAREATSPDLHRDEIPGATVERLSRVVTHLVRVGALCSETEVRDGKPAETKLSVDRLVARLLFP